MTTRNFSCFTHLSPECDVDVQSVPDLPSHPEQVGAASQPPAAAFPSSAAAVAVSRCLTVSAAALAPTRFSRLVRLVVERVCCVRAMS